MLVSFFAVTAVLHQQHCYTCSKAARTVVTRHCECSEAIQSTESQCQTDEHHPLWMASGQALAMTRLFTIVVLLHQQPRVADSTIHKTSVVRYA
jgi:hypothetical protein